ncbi:centromere-associated protein E isoform X2 [Ascaphus truei]|uniref:centromere-associated protein E isoform X2 n=1 Tax=Ascaphus truei TaxID=8439 RepID=UPI003F592C77
MSDEDAVKVCVRLRPLIQREESKEHGDKVMHYWTAENSTIAHVESIKSFHFDRVFQSNEKTDRVYQEMAVQIVYSAIQGYNGTIFAYGQTASGKTYTMMGTETSLGILPQAVQDVFKMIQKISNNREFLLRVSYMEIYNETVTDLLCDDRKKKPLEIREDINRNVYVADLVEELVVLPEQVMHWITKGEKNRHYGETKMNEHSSRSHTIFRMIIESREKNDPGGAENCDGAVMVSHLNLVDLAGSERASQTGAEGVRLKEGCNINRSLFILGQVIKKLGDGQVGGFINYRDSKLTRILQNSLGGNAKTVIICTITSVCYDETLSTLQFASAAKNMKNTPQVNEVLDDQALLKRYRKEIMNLKKQLEGLEASSETRAQAMAKEEHGQLLEEIQQLRKEREERIWNLKNRVVASSEVCTEDQREKRKRRVTWAPGKIQNLCTANISGFNIVSKISSNFNKRAKISVSTISETADDSVCTEFSDFDDRSRVLDDFGLEIDCNLSNKVSRREKFALGQQMIEDFTFEGPMNQSVQIQDGALLKYKELEQQVAELENQVQKLTKENEAEAEKRASLAKEILRLQQLQSDKEKNELLKTDLESQLCAKTENNGLGEPSLTVDGQRHAENLVLRNKMVLEGAGHIAGKNEEERTVDGTLQCTDSKLEHQTMLEQKIADLEEIIANFNMHRSPKDKNCHEQEFMESIQLCEALMTEKGKALTDIAVMQNNFDSVLLDNESLKREIAEMERQLVEKADINTFERLESETQKEQEAELQSKSKLLKEREEQLHELQKQADKLQRKVRNMDLSVSMGNSETLCEELFQVKQSLSDAETVTRDAQKESAFLRSENLELKEKMEVLSSHHKQMEKDVSLYQKQLETEKRNYKKMQNDLQKELQCAFNEIMQLNNLMAGKVPKDLLSRVELEKKIADYSKQLSKGLDEKHDLQKEVASLSEYKSLPSEVEYLKQQVFKTSEELSVLKHEREQSATILSDKECKLQELSEKIENLTEELTHTQSTCQQVAEKYLELKNVHDELQEKCMLTAAEMTQKQSEAEGLFQEVEQLKDIVETVEGKLSTKIQELEEVIKDKECLLLEGEELVQAKEMLFSETEQLKEQLETTHFALSTAEENKNMVNIQLDTLQEEFTVLRKEKEEVQRSIEAERDNLKEQVNKLSSLLAIHQEQDDKHETDKERDELEQTRHKLIEMGQLQKHLNDTQSALDTMQWEMLEAAQKLKALQDDYQVSVQERNELRCTLEDLKAERDNLKQDLKENIELSIETQDDLRTTQEELKGQKELVDDLKRQVTDYAGSIPLIIEDQTLKEKLLQLEEQLKDTISMRDQVLVEHTAIVEQKQELVKLVSTITRERDALIEKCNDNLQVFKTSEELSVLKHEREQSATILSDKESKLQELSEKIENLTEELTHTQSTSQQVAEKYLELKNVHDELQEKCMLTTAEMTQKQSEAEGLFQEVEQLKGIVETVEGKLSTKIQELEEVIKDKECLLLEGEELVQAKEMLFLETDQLKEQLKTTHFALSTAEENKNMVNIQLDTLQEEFTVLRKEKEEVQRSIEAERDNLKEQVNKLSSLLAIHQEQDDKHETDKEREELEQTRHKLIEMGQLQKHLNDTQSALDTMQWEMLEAAQKLKALQDDYQVSVQERNELRCTLEDLKAERDNLKQDLKENIELSIETQDDLRTTQEELKGQKELVDDLKRQVTDYAGSIPLIIEDQTLKEKLLQLEEQLKDTISMRDQVLVEHTATVEQKQELVKLVSTITRERDALIEKCNDNLQVSSLMEELQENETKYEKLHRERDEVERARQSLVCEMEQLQDRIKAAESALGKVEKERLEATQKLLTFEELQRSISQEREDLNMQGSHKGKGDQLKEETENVKVLTELNLFSETNLLQDGVQQSKDKILAVAREQELQDILVNVRSERDQLKLDLQETIEMSIETQEQLRCALEELGKKSQLLDDLRAEANNEFTIPTDQTSLGVGLEHKLLQLEEQLKDTIRMRDQVIVEHTAIVEQKQELVKLVSTITRERDALIEKCNDNLQSIETQDELRRAQEELQQQKHTVAALNNQILESSSSSIQEKSVAMEKISLLEEKLSSVEEEMGQNMNTLKETLSEKAVLSQSLQLLTSEMERFNERLKSNESAFEKVEKENLEAAQKIFALTEEIRSVSQEKDQLQHLKETFKEEAKKSSDELQQLQYQHDLLWLEKKAANHRLEGLVSEIKRLKEKITNDNASSQQIQAEKASLVNCIQEHEMQISTLHRDREQLQQLNEGIRTENNRMYTNLQDQEKVESELREELNTCQTELQAIKQLKDQLNGQLTEKTNTLDNLLQQISSLQQQLQQLHQDLKDEKNRNCDLREEVDLKEKQMLVLPLIQNAPFQEDVQLVDVFEKKNQQIQDLMGKIADVFSNHNHLLNNITSDLHDDVEAQKLSMSNAQKSLSSALSRSFENILAQNLKLNNKLQSLLNKFKVVCRKTAIKEEHYTTLNYIKDNERNLSAEQRNHDELLLQFQCLERHGTKWSEAASDELKNCELKHLNKLLSGKIELIKHIEEDFSATQVILATLGDELHDELKSKKDFLRWLDEIHGLHFDAMKLSEGFQQENKRIAETVKLVIKRLEALVPSKTQTEMSLYKNRLDHDLQETKAKRTELLKTVQCLAPGRNTNEIEKENARLLSKLRTLETELKTMQTSIQNLEMELGAAKSHAKQKEATLLQNKLLSREAELELANLQVKMTEKENNLQTALKEMQTLQEKVADGTKPYRAEIDNLKTRLVKIEMGKIKLSKSMEQEMTSLKSCMEDKEENIRKLKEQLRRTQQDHDTSVFDEKDHPSSSKLALTCGGGSGIVQSTAMLVLRSEKARLEKELSRYKSHCNRLSRNMLHLEDELKEWKGNVIKTQSHNLDAVHEQAVSPRKPDLPRQHAMSPSKSEIPVFSSVCLSPCKKQNLPEKKDSPKSKFFDARSKSLPITCPTRFFDHPKLAPFPESSPAEASESNQSDEWWASNTHEPVSECKQS